jgi:hypothetical protein
MHEPRVVLVYLACLYKRSLLMSNLATSHSSKNHAVKKRHHEKMKARCGRRLPGSDPIVKTDNIR